MAMEASKKFARPFVENFHSIGMVRFETKKKFLKDFAENSYSANRISLENEIIRNSSAIISLAESEKESLKSFYACPEEKVRVIRGGVNLRHWPPTEKEKARDFLRIDQKAFVMLYVGRLEWRKGIGTLISAASLLKKEVPNLKVMVVGGKIFGQNVNAADSREYKRLKKKAEEEGIGEIVTFTGNIDHGRLPVYYRAADVFVIPSYYEPFGLVALESMASKIPVIASRVDGLAVTIEDGRTGLLFEPRNALSLKNKIMKICLSKDFAENLCENAYFEITKNYSWPNIAEKIGSIYDELIIKKYENNPTLPF
jgi:glycosyltransferase involved in cell wall biosynthesis